MTRSSDPGGDARAVDAKVPAGVSPEEALARVGRALSHPLRIRIILTLADTGEESPLTVSRKIGAPLGNVSYHFRYLAGVGAIELRRVVPRRGAMQHFYVLTPTLRVLLPLTRQMGAAAAIAELGSHRAST